MSDNKDDNFGAIVIAVVVLGCCFMVTSCEELRIKTNKDLKIETSLIVSPESHDKPVSP